MLNQFQNQFYLPNNINQTLNFGRIYIKIQNIDYKINNQLQIRSLILKEVSKKKKEKIFI